MEVGVPAVSESPVSSSTTSRPARGDADERYQYLISKVVPDICSAAQVWWLCLSGHVLGQDAGSPCNSMNWTISETFITVHNSSSFDFLNASAMTAGASSPAINKTNSSLINITNLSPGCQYHLAFLQNGTQLCNTSVYTVPSPVSNVQLSNKSERSVLLSWSPPSDLLAANYSYRIAVHNQTASQQNVTTNDTKYNVTGLQPGLPYTFTIYSVTTDGVQSTRSESVSATTFPSPVSNVQLSNKSERSVLLSWSPPSDLLAANYSYRIAVHNQTASQQNVSTNDTKYNVTGLQPGVPYTFTIYSVTTDGVQSTRSESVNATTFPSPVSNEQLNNKSERSVLLSWSPPSDLLAANYSYRIAVHNQTASQQNVSTNDTKYNVTGLQPGVPYTFTIYSVTTDGVQSTRSESVSATTYPSTVHDIQMTSRTVTSISIDWSAPNDVFVSSYTYLVNVTGEHKSWNNSTNETQFTAQELDAGSIYNFTVQSQTSDGVRSMAETISIYSAPNSPRDLQWYAVNASEILLNWTAPPDPNRELYSYSITWVSQSMAPSSGSDSSGATSFNITSLEPGTLYSVNVTSVIEGASSVVAGTPAQTAPQSPENLTIQTITNTSVTVCWHLASSSQEQLSGFQVVTETDDGTVKIENIPDPSARNWTICDLLPGTNYTLMVRSVKISSLGPIPAMGAGGRPRRATSTSNVIETFSPFLTQTILTDPGMVLVVSCSKESGGYSLRVIWERPAGSFTEVWVLVDGKQRVNTTEYNVEVKGLQPAASYGISMETVAYDKSVVSPSITCSTDSTGVIVGSIFGVLLFLLLVGLLVFLVLRHRRWRNVPESSPVNLDNIPSTVRVQDFPSYFYRKAADSGFGFAEEYQQLASKGMNQARVAGDLPANKAKNRYTNVLPYDHSRVRLRSTGADPSTDYINANYILGYSSDKEFIATQGPLPGTLGDFWRLVWEQHVGTIVMLTNCTESGKLKCERYWPLDYTPCTYQDIMVTVANETILPEWTIRDFHLKHAREAGVHAVRHFHYTVWPDHGVPENTATVIRFRNLVREYIDQRNGDGPTVIHCSAGVGRTGTLIALDYLMQQMERERRVGVYSFVMRMRMNRCLMVQTESQYVFLNKCMLDLIQRPTESIYENPMDSLIYENVSAVQELQEAA
ncbi:LOW QUALITY PROTEIN: receptor-type tyrosine-protein phosphatase H [Rhinatrema bivittatum]|uniref:LOW QUALITY PROTEIN: receptor-type tyrosine-protein phosphatase H n=1 Tax=Rhinatrema bivittatum TaxID=194408 RepID=UPI001127C4AE|nr:LOW QUALITY PROTEIN: receptor-type tyrosine-protein phosphatase H [Rhinatrema bivittatum]